MPERKINRLEMKSTDLALIASALILAFAILVQGGFYTFETSDIGIVYKHNKITGSTQICFQDEDCKDFSGHKLSPLP